MEPVMGGIVESPEYDELVGELKALRGPGLMHARRLPLAALRHAAQLHQPGLGLAGTSPAAIEQLLRLAAARLGDGPLGMAAQFTFGLVDGTRDWPAGHRRARAAQAYGVSVERFRKHQENLVIAQTAEQVIAVCMSGRRPEARPQRRVPAMAVDTQLDTPAGRVVLHQSPIDLMTAVDIVVSSENIYFEMAQTFKSSISASLRLSAGHRSPVGVLLDDVLQRELNEWMARAGRGGLPVAAGTVAATSPGDLARNGIRRIYHAAVASPLPGTDEYKVEPAAIVKAVRNAFRLAETEREQHDPPLSSICFPLFGAGHGGLDPATSIGWLWSALAEEMATECWSVHLVTRRPEVAETISRHLTGVVAGVGA